MKKLGRVVGHIPARGGSKRVPAKNLRYLDGKPMLGYAIECALQSGVLPDVYVNTDSETIADFGRSCGAKAYMRPAALGADTTTGDDFTADFIRAIGPDVLVMISPVCPLVTPDDVCQALQAFRESDCDTLISCQTTQMQTFCKRSPVNIDVNAPLAPSQLNPEVQILNWAVTIWDTAVFMRSYETCRSGYIGTNRLLFPIDPVHAVKVSHEKDFRQAEMMLQARRMEAGVGAENKPIYWEPAVG